MQAAPPAECSIFARHYSTLYSVGRSPTDGTISLAVALAPKHNLYRGTFDYREDIHAAHKYC
jgi:hypothetical protein